MLPRILLSIAFFMPTAALPQAAQHFPSDSDVLELLRTRVEEGRATGLVVGLLEADGTRRIQAYGSAGPGALELGAETVFEIAPVLLKNEGRIDELIKAKSEELSTV